MPNQIDFRFQINNNSPYAAIAKYLSPTNKTLPFPRHNMIIWAITAFWHPMVCEWEGGLTESELKAKARESIYQLQQQITLLARTFNLEQEVGEHRSRTQSSINREKSDTPLVRAISF